MSATTQGLSKNFDAIIGTAVTFVILATGTMVLRVTAKLVTKGPFKFEDYTIFLAFFLYIATEGLLMRCVVVGRYAQVLNDKYDQYYVELASVYSDFYFAIIALCIASMSLLYRRLFIAKRRIRIIATTILFVDLGWWISSTIIEITFPSTYPETFPGNPGIRSITANYLTWWLAAGIIEVTTIIITILIPIGQLRKLHMDYRKKILLGITFSMSFLCVATGIARLATLYRPGARHFDGSIGDVWINAHLGSAIMSANLPTCWPIVSHRKQIISYLRSGRSSEKEDSRSPGGSQATMWSRASLGDLERVPTSGTVGSAARKNSAARGTVTACETDSVGSNWNRDNGNSSAEDIEYHNLVSTMSAEHPKIQRPPNTYLGL